MFIYLASPYTPLGEGSKEALKEYRFQEVCRAAAKLMENGNQVFCPIAHSHPIEKYGMDEIHDGDFWLEQDYAVLIHVDELWVLMLEGWDKSHGVKEEIDFAHDYGISVRYLKPGEVIPEGGLHGSDQEAFA